MPEVKKIDTSSLPPLPSLEPIRLSSYTDPFPTDRFIEASNIFPIKQDPAPSLTPPSEYRPTSYAAAVSKMLETITAVGGLQKQSATNMADSIEHSLSVRQSESLDKMTDEASYAQTASWCDYFRRIGFCLLSTCSFVMGSAMIANHPTSLTYLVCGAATITSAVASLIGSTMIDARSSPELATYLVIISSAFGMLSGTTYLSLNANSAADIVGKIAIASLSIITNVASLGNHYAQFQIEDLKAVQTMLKESMIRWRNIIYEGAEFQDHINHATITSIGSLSHSAQQIERAKKMIIASMINTQV